MTPDTRRRGTTVPTLLAALALASPHAPAQQPAQQGAQQGAQQPAQQGAGATGLAQPEQALRSATGLELQRLALIDLRLLETPGPEDYREAALMLSLAERLRPADAELTRRTCDAAFAAGDRALLDEATRRLLRNDPNDAVAMLRFLTARIEERQTIEERLDAYDRLLSTEGTQRLDPSVISRLAFDAALLHRETGAIDRFADLLGRAVLADPTNKQALSFAAAYYAGQLDDPVGNAELQLALLMADPHDPHVHLTVARSLAAHGALDQAARFNSLAHALFEADGQTPPDAIIERMALQWMLGNAWPVVVELDELLRREREIAAARRTRAEQLNLPLDTLPTAEQIFPPLQVFRMHALATASLADGLKLDALVTALERQVLEADTTPALGLSPIATRLLLAEVLLWTGGDAARADRVLADAEGINPEITTLTPDLFAWREYRLGRIDTATQLADALDPAVPEHALLLAELALARNDTPAASGHFAAAARAGSRTATGPWALHRLRTVAPDAPVRTATGDRLAQLADRVPGWVDDMVTDPLSFMALRVTLDRRSEDPSADLLLRVSLENTAPIPLGLGPDRPLQSRIMLYPILSIAQQDLRGEGEPEVLDLSRRFRLNSRERLEVTAQASPAVMGYVLDVNSQNVLPVRWRIIQGFRINDSGGFISGPLALTAETPQLFRPPLPEARLSAVELAAALDTASGDVLVRLLQAARSLLLYNPAHFPELEVELIAQTAAKRLGREGSTVDLALIAGLPHSIQRRGMLAFDLAAREHAARLLDQAPSDPSTELIAAAVLFTRVRATDDPWLADAANAPSPLVADLARLRTLRLAQPRPSYSRATAAVDDLTGPTLKKLLEYWAELDRQQFGNQAPASNPVRPDVAPANTPPTTNAPSDAPQDPAGSGG